MHQGLRINKNIKEVSLLGVWHMDLPIFVTYMQNEQCQSKLNNSFSFAVISNRGGYNFIVI